MIFQRALRRELAASAGATFTVLFSILVTWTLISILGKAAGGRVASGDVLALIMFAMLNYMPTVLTLTSFISVLMVVTRSYRDSEMVVWFASGLSLVRWIRPRRTGRSNPQTMSTTSTLATKACSPSPPAARRRSSESRGRVACGVRWRSITTQSPTTGGGTTGRPNMARTGPVSSATMSPAPSWRTTRPTAGSITSAASGEAR